ncbi:MAG: hypothetical protein ABI321_13100 [Polyangia bacterium]
MKNTVLLAFALALPACSHTTSLAPGGRVPGHTIGATAGWRALPGAPTIAGKQDDVFFTDASTGWSVNGLGRIYHTTDGGQTWTKQLDKPGTYFRAIAFVDRLHGFASNIGTDYYPNVTDEHPLYSTVDGGVTWQPVTAITGPMPKGICNLDVVDAQHLVGAGRIGGPSFFIRSSDGGATWTSTDLSAQLPMLVDAHFTSPTDGVLIGGSDVTDTSQCTVLHTSDGGQTFTKVFTAHASGTVCWKLSFPSAQVGYASVLPLGSATSSFLKTVDGGATWSEKPFVADTYGALGIGFADETTGWIAGEAKDKPAYRTNDGGATWIADASLGPYINRFRFVGKVGYAIGSTIYKLVLP